MRRTLPHFLNRDVCIIKFDLAEFNIIVSEAVEDFVDPEAETTTED